MKKIFSSTALQQVNTEAAPIIASHLEGIARVSDDIRTLELTLKEAAIPFVFVYVFKTHGNIRPGNGHLSYPDGIPYSSNINTYEEHCLVWGRGKENEPRFFYNIYVTEDEAHPVYDPLAPAALNTGKPFLKFSRPVCETKANVRMQIELELPVFYKRIIHNLQSNKTSDCIIEECKDLYLTPSKVLKYGIPE